MPALKLWDGSQWVSVAGPAPEVYNGVAQPTPRDNYAIWIDTDELATQAAPEPVHKIGGTNEPAFQNGWVNYDNSAAVPAGGTSRDAYFYRHDGRVYLGGVIKGGTSNTVAFTLPVGYRSLVNNLDFTVTCNGGPEIANVSIIAGSGAVQVRAIGTSRPDIHCFLEGISFLCAPAPFLTQNPPLVTALPATPYDGQEVYYRPTPGNNGELWHLRYREASPSAYKWEFLGGQPLTALSIPQALMSPAATGTSYALPSSPSITLPLAGDWIVEFGVGFWVREIGTAPLVGTLLFVWDGTTRLSESSFMQAATQYEASSPATAKERINGLAAGKVLSLGYQATNGTGSNVTSTSVRRLAVTPLRVG